MSPRKWEESNAHGAQAEKDDEHISLTEKYFLLVFRLWWLYLFYYELWQKFSENMIRLEKQLLEDTSGILGGKQWKSSSFDVKDIQIATTWI